MSNTNVEHLLPGDSRDLYSGMIRLRVLHQAMQKPVFGMAILEELSRHGYRISPGTLYPLLHSLERRGYLRSHDVSGPNSRRKVYRATAVGRKALALAKTKVRELFREWVESK